MIKRMLNKLQAVNPVALLQAGRLSGDYKRFALMNFFYGVFTNLNTVFINTLFIRLTNDTNIVLKYNIIYFLTVAVIMVVSVSFMRRLGPTTLTRIGIGGYVVMYIVFFACMNQLTLFMPLIAVLTGSASGFYCMTYSYWISELSTDDNREAALSLLGLLSGVTSLFMPTISGFVIGSFPDNFIGYYIMFGISFVVAIFTILISFRLPFRKLQTKKTYLKQAFRDCFTNRCWFSGIFMQFLVGLREGTFGFFLNVLLFTLVKDERIVGFNTFLVGIITLAAYAFVGKFVKPTNRIKYIFVATTSLLLLTALLFLELSPITVIMLSLANTFFGTLIVNPSISILYLLLQKMPGGEENKTEYLAVREVFLGVGRLIGIGLILVLPQDNLGCIVAMFILTLSQYITVLFGKWTLSLLAKETGESES